jgi:hypothetical protein
VASGAGRCACLQLRHCSPCNTVWSVPLPASPSGRVAGGGRRTPPVRVAETGATAIDGAV